MKKIILVPVFVLMMILSSIGVLAAGGNNGGGVGILAHNATVTLTPDQANCGGPLNEFTVNIKNEGPTYSIYNVKIYTAQTNIVNITCGAAPSGWTFEGFKFGLYCEYLTNPTNATTTIAPGEDVDFTFEAGINRTECETTFRVTSLDNEAIITGQGEGTEVNNFPTLFLDCSPPNITKNLGNPKLPGNGFDWWITQSTNFQLDVSDKDSPFQCDLGLDYCEYRYDLDGVEEMPWTRIQWDNVQLPAPFHYFFNFMYDEDSEHFLEVRCYDVVGNMAYHSQTEKVDDTPPTTKKKFIGPNKTVNDIEWIDGVTTIELSATDGGLICHIDGVETYYYIEMDESERSCLDASVCDNLQAPDIGPQDWTLYTGPIGGIPESCHILYYYSKDKLNNTENVKTNCFFVDHTAPDVTKIIGKPHVDVPYILSTFGSGVSEVSSNEASEGDDSIHLGAPQIQYGVTPEHEGRIFIPLDGMTLGDLDSIMWDAFVVDGYPPHVDILLDVNGDGSFDPKKDLVTGALTGDNDDVLVAEWAYNPLSHYARGTPYTVAGDYNTWINTFNDGGSVDDATNMWLYSACPGAPGSSDFVIGTLAEWKTGKTRDYECYPSAAGDGALIDSNTKLIGIEIEVDGWVAASEAYVDMVKVNDIGRLSLHWVTQDTPISFECTDPQPHPSGDEELCFKVSYDLDPDGYNTDDYCTKYEGNPENGWCCVPASPNDNFVFDFDEDSNHDLEYFCRDAVEKKSAVHKQYYKVDTEPPYLVDKDIIGPFYEKVGDCPPDDPTDVCHLDGVSLINITVEDGGDICAVGVKKCYWWYYVTEPNGTVTRHPQAPQVNYGFPINFPEESEHELHIKCKDELGNEFEDVETFYVDKTPPVTTKEYGMPFVMDNYPKGCILDQIGQQVCPAGNISCVPVCVLAEWISVATDITLTATDDIGPHDSGIEKTMYRVTQVNDEACGNNLCDEYQGTGNFLPYIGPFNIDNESCHLIEYYSVDNVNKTEMIKKQCVFVDDSAPNVTKVVGEPSVACDANGQAISVNSPGDSLRLINGSYSQGSCSINTGIAFDGTNLIVSCWNYNVLDLLSPADGSLQGTVTVPGYNGLYANAWDGTRNMLWQCADSNKVILVNMSDGSSTFMFTATDQCVDGFAYDGTDDTIWTSGDVHYGLYHYHTNGTLIEILDMTGKLGGYGNSGIAVGGDTLYLANNGGSQIYSAPKDLSGSTLFATYPERLEDMECDDVTFAGQGVGAIWSMDAYDRKINAYEIPAGQCGVGGLPAKCGDGNLDAGEQCDDGNNKNGDGCSASCRIEVPGDVCDYYITNRTPIDLYCNDVLPHPVDHVNITYRYRLADDCDDLDDANWTAWMNGGAANGAAANNLNGGNPYLLHKTIYMPEDSCHEIEYKCVDGLGNTAGPYSEIDIVDTQAPIITKDVTGPYFGQCPPQSKNDSCYVDNATTIIVDAVDPEPHPVDDVQCKWKYFVFGGKPGIDSFDVNAEMAAEGQGGGGWNHDTPPFNVKFPEESYHLLFVKCWDALGNKAWDVEKFIVDHSPPVIDKTYSGPYFRYNDSDMEAEWISSLTEVNISVYDPQPHPSGVDEVMYRTTVVDDEYCRHYFENDTMECDDAVGDGNWMEGSEDFIFSIPDESCHLIEVVANDNVNKTSTHKQCVFVDNTPPTPVKTVGRPAYPINHTLNWDDYEFTYGPFQNVNGRCFNESSSDPIDCWEVFKSTPIELACEDRGNHPVDHNNVCFKLLWDGQNHDLTEQYCDNINGGVYNKYGDGYCCTETEIKPFYFSETTEHNLAYYCEDALGNSNREDVDDEKFKVRDIDFEIQLNTKWNLISVPVRLADNSMDEVFKDIAENVTSVWQFDGLNWHVYTPNGDPNDDDITEMEAGWGYWVKNTDPATLLIGGDLIDGGGANFPVIPIVYGWNLIGYIGTDGEESYHGPQSYDSPVGSTCDASIKLSTLVNTPSMATWWEPYNTDGDQSTHELVPLTASMDKMDPGAGYWLFYSGNNPNIQYTWVPCPNGG